MKMKDGRELFELGGDDVYLELDCFDVSMLNIGGRHQGRLSQDRPQRAAISLTCIHTCDSLLDVPDTSHANTLRSSHTPFLRLHRSWTTGRFIDSISHRNRATSRWHRTNSSKASMSCTEALRTSLSDYRSGVCAVLTQRLQHRSCPCRYPRRPDLEQTHRAATGDENYGELRPAYCAGTRGEGESEDDIQGMRALAIMEESGVGRNKRRSRDKTMLGWKRAGTNTRF